MGVIRIHARKRPGPDNRRGDCLSKDLQANFFEIYPHWQNQGNQGRKGLEDPAIGINAVPKRGGRCMIRRVRRSLMLKWTLFSIFLATIPLAIAGFRIIQIYQADLKKSVIEIEEM